MLKIYDSSSGRYVTVASNRGDKLYTKSINFQSPELPNYDDDSSIITIDEALTSISDEIKKNKEGIAWIYKNGTLGGGGGSGAGVPKFKVTTTNGNIKDNNIIVNNNQTLNLTFSVTGSAAGRRMIITIKDNKGNFYNYNNSAYIVSTSGTTIQIPNITEDIYIEFSGYDQETLSIIEPYTLNIKVAELKITGPDAVEISKSDTAYNLTYDIKTTAGQNTRVILSTIFDNIIYTYESDVFTNSRKITIDLFKVFLNSDPALNLVDLLHGNLIDNMEITAQAIAGDYTSSTSTSIVFTSETDISIDIIPFSSETSTESIYEYLENDNMSFNIKLYFNTNEFYVYYKLYQIDENNVENIVYSKGDINNPTSDDNKLSSTKFYTKNNPINISYPTDINVNNGPVYIFVKAWDRVNPVITGERTKKCKIISDTTWAPYNLSLSGKDTAIDGGLNYLYYEFNTKDIGNINISDIWTTSRIYTGSSLMDPELVKGSIKYFKANNINNGLILRGGLENTNTLRMASNTHAILLDKEGNPVRPFTNDSSNWFNNEEGWTISLSFKSDIQPKTDNVIFSCASFSNKGEFDEGIYITTEDVNVSFSNANGQINKWKLRAKITQNTLNHVDIVYKPKTFDNGTKIGELMIYINGVLSAAGVEQYIDFKDNNYPTISNDIIFGATQNKGVIFNHSDVNFYRILFYKRYLSAYHVTKNMIQGDAEIKLLENGNIDKLTNAILRQKNFFNEDGTCSLINANTYKTECEFAADLYSNISTNGKNPLPIVFIYVPEKGFKDISEERHNESDVAFDKTLPDEEKRITKPYIADITIIKERSNKPFVMGTNSGNQSIVDDFTGRKCTIKLQGTSTLGNKSKNYEISFGANQTQEHLVQPFADMLPENSWILKADVMDSGHANNAAIGGFINDYMAKYPTTAQNDNQYPYASEIKATTKGHPVMLFIQFGENGNKEFMGIYSFNLGRISHYNLGYKKFDGNYKVISERGDTEGKLVEYENHTVKDTTIEFPAYVSSYKSVAVPYTSDLNGISPDDTTAVCYECIANDDIVGTFQQSNANIINEFYNRVYPEVGNANTDKAFERFNKLFVATSNLYACDPEYLCKLAEGKEYLKTRSLYQRNDKGEFLNSTTNKYEAFNSANERLYVEQPLWQPTDPFSSLTSPQNNGNGNDTGLNWEYLSAYFTLAMLFGLVDSLGKNLNIRSFDLKNWYLEFYDMDTGLALTNTGYENVKKDVYLDAFSMSSDKQSADVKINGYGDDGFETKNSRLFNIVRFFTTKEFPNSPTKPKTNYRKIWEDIRSTVLRNPDEFINKYYIKQNEFVGEMIFNYDYDIKYINDEIDAITKNTSEVFGSINFLHGNRINFVRDWFTKHVYFLDGVFDIKCQAPATEETKKLFGDAAGSMRYGLNEEGGIRPNDSFTPNAENVICPYISFSNQNDRINPPSNGGATFKLRANIPLFFIFNNGALNKQRLYVPENVETEVYLNIKSGGQTTSFNYEPYLTTFGKFGNLPYVTLRSNLAMLNELDLSDLQSLSGENFDISYLVELRKLNMNNVKITGTNKLRVDLANAKKISYIDLRNSDVESLILPMINGKLGGVIEKLYIDNTDISRVDLTDNVMLQTFSASGCDNLRSLTFVNNNALESFGTLPKNISNLTIKGCNSLTEIKLSGMNNLSNDTFVLGHNENVKKFEYTAGPKAENVIDKLDLSGCPNIEEINLQNFTGTFITLNVESKNTLKKVNFTNSNISYIQWYDSKDEHTEYTKINGSYEDVLDFSDCKNMDHIVISGQKTVKYLILPKGRTIENDKLDIARCEKLERIIGEFETNVNKFRNLSSFRFNEVCKYDADDTTSFITLTNDGSVNINGDTNTPKDGPFEDEHDNKKWYYEIDLSRSLTNYSFIEDGAKIEGSFSGTGINISDLYAILIKLREWKSKEYISEGNEEGLITEFVKTFEGCANIRTGCTGSKYELEKQNIRLDIFTLFKKLLKLDSTFKGCSNINGLITTAHDEPREPYSNSIFNNGTLNEINGVFNECGNIKISSLIFYYTPSLKIINSPFSSTTEHHINTPDYAVSFKYIFKNNKHLEEIKRLFNGTSVKFKYSDYSGVDISDLFKNNPNVKTIQYLLSDKFGALNTFGKYDINFANIFGGVSKYNNDTEALDGANYPTHLKNLDHAFAIDNPLTDTAFTINWTDMDYIFYGQECEYNDETNCYENTTLETCAYMFDHLATISENDADGYVNWGGDSSVATFPLNMFNTTYKENDDTEHEVWFTKLNSCEGLFKRSAFKAELKFPGNIFKHCVADNLNLSHLLEDSIMTPIKLVTVDDVDENGNNYACFANCKLGDISSMFANCFRGIEKKDFKDAELYKSKLYKYDRGGLHGLIPYKFFKNAGKITNMNNLFEGCCHLGNSVDLTCDSSGNYVSGNGDFKQRSINDFYSVKRPSLEVVESVASNQTDKSALLDLVEYDSEKGIYVWNAWSYDGTVFDDDYLAALNSITLDGLSYTAAKRKNIHNYIDFEWKHSDKPHDDVINNIDSGYLEFRNDNQKESLRRSSYAGEYIENVNGVPIYRIYYDADYDIKNVNYDISYFGYQQLWNCDSYTYLDNTGDYKSQNYKHNTQIAGATPTVFISNYMVPMDLFRYCAPNCTIDGIFMNVSKFNGADKRSKINDYVYGLIGRIPPRLFSPLTELTTMVSVFENCNGIIPYAQSLDGLMYNFSFEDNTSVSAISAFFKGTLILGNLSSVLFDKLTKLVNISNLCRNGYMPPEYAAYDETNNNKNADYVNFLPSEIFKNNTQLSNLSYAFARENNNDELIAKSHLYFTLNTDLLTTDTHKLIQNVSGMFTNQNRGVQRKESDKTTFIDFRLWPYINNMSSCYSGANFDVDKIPEELGGRQKN